MRRIYRYQVPVDDSWHDFPLDSDPLHVASRQMDLVEFWAWSDDNGAKTPRRLGVVGTGHPVPTGARHWGTAVIGAAVWHLVEIREGDGDESG